MLDGTSPDPIGDYKAIQLELELFNPALLEKPQVGARSFETRMWECAELCCGVVSSEQLYSTRLCCTVHVGWGVVNFMHVYDRILLQTMEQQS